MHERESRRHTPPRVRPGRARSGMAAAIVAWSVMFTTLVVSPSARGQKEPVAERMPEALTTITTFVESPPSAELPSPATSNPIPREATPTSVVANAAAARRPPAARSVPRLAGLGPLAPTRAASTLAAATAHRGRSHVWIPSLGISRSVQSFPCSRSRPPDAGVYRWGCAGRNNVYLMSHAWSAFRPLHDAYVRGDLRVGLRVRYADRAGRVHRYRVTWWRVTAPTTAASWAWADQRKPSMTLQTCVGANGQKRLMVRLVEVG
jgi:hypothetical protein